MDGPNAPRPLPQAPVPTFHTPSIDATRRAAAAPSDSELAAADDAHDAAVDDSSGDEAQTPAQRAAARKARKAAKKKDLRSAGFGSPGAESEDPSASGLTLADDPRFRQAAKTADLRQQAQFADMWSPAAACQNGVLDAECPAVHRHLHAEVPDAITFECSASTDCHGYPCVQGQCVCGGLAVGTDCGSRRLLHFEWAQPGAVAKSSAEQRSGVPSLATFRRLLRGTSPHDALEEVIRAFSLVQDPQQSELDAKVQAKLKPELEFLLRAAAETSPDGALDLTSLAEEALHTSLQTMIWMSKNIVRYVPMPRALRLGVQDHGASWFFEPLAEILRWAQHPGAAPLDFARASEKYKPHTLLSLATHWQLYPAMQMLLAYGGDAARVPGALREAVANHDLTALKILLEAGLDPNDPREKDAFGRSPLQLARLAQDSAFDDVLGHLVSVAGDDAEAEHASAVTAKSGKKRRRRAAEADDSAADAKEAESQAVSRLGDTGGVFFEQAGTDIQLNCDVDVVKAADLSTERFLRDYASAGRPVIIEGAIDDWGISTFQISTFPNELGQADVAANQIPYGDALGVESHGMKLRDYLGYMRTASASSDSEPPLVVYDSSFLDSPGLSNTDYRPGSMGDEGGDTFYHHSRYPWSGPGALTDAMNAISDRDTARWPHFFVGPRNAGGGFQTRCSLFTSVTDGQQLFMAYPPSQPGFGSAISREHPLEWLRNVNQQSPEILQGFAGLPRYANPLSCVLRPGYTLYTPPLWTSSTINIEPSMGLSFEVVNNCIV
eukprot:INCI18063.1.p1 GENE.INCI18063.1~~INCI18063.1.p1  ORF type:complete len:882 (+),score=184.94 INCI18063.1:304-2646(+)